MLVDPEPQGRHGVSRGAPVPDLRGPEFSYFGPAQRVNSILDREKTCHHYAKPVAGAASLPATFGALTARRQAQAQ